MQNKGLFRYVLDNIEQHRSSPILLWRTLIILKDFMFDLLMGSGLFFLNRFGALKFNKRGIKHVFRKKRRRLHIKYRYIRNRLKDFKNPRLVYYKFFYVRKILSSKPIVCKPNKHFELHILSCKKNILDSLWSLKTFSFYSGLQFDLYIHSDGSLNEKHKKIYTKHFPGCKVIDRDTATSQMETKLKNYPYSLMYRKKKPFYCSLKLFDPLYISKSDNILYIDSDILFFRKPSQIIRNLKNNTPFFNRDMESSYSADPEKLDKLFKIKIRRNFNAGLIMFNKKDYIRKLDFIEHFFQTVDEQNIRCRVGPNHHEQTLHAILGGIFNSHQLNNNYQPGNESVTDQTISCHFFSGARPERFYLRGLRKLKEKNFLNDFNAVTIRKKRTLIMNTSEGHLGGYIYGGDPSTYFPELWQWIRKRFMIDSVVDVGCGEGHAAKFFKNMECSVLGIDGSAQAISDSVIPEHAVKHDYIKGPYKTDACDMIWSCEFVEHVEEKYIENFLQTFTCAKKFVFMTYAAPKQVGYHHVNCQTQEYWIKHMQDHGFVYSQQITRLARRIAGHGHFRVRGLVFINKEYSLPTHTKLLLLLDQHFFHATQ